MKFAVPVVVCSLSLSAKVLAAPACNYAVQMFFAQDSSGSFKNDIPNVRTHFPLIVEEMAENYAGSMFKLGAFTDVPMYPLGCHDKNDHPYEELTDWTSDPKVMEEAFGSFKLHWGADYPEAQLMFMAHAALSGAFPEERVTEDGRPYRRFLVMSTDDRYHKAGDSGFPDYYYDQSCTQYPNCCPDKLTAFKRIPFQADGVLRMPYEVEGFMETEDYPKENDVPKWLKEADIALIVLISQGESNPNWKHWVSFIDLVKEEGVPATLVELDEKSENLRDAIISGVEELEDLVCPTTTTPEPTTPEPTTTTPKTTTPATTTPAPPTTTPKTTTTKPVVTEAPTEAPTPKPTTKPVVTEAPVVTEVVTEAPPVVTEAPTPKPTTVVKTESAVMPPPPTEAPTPRPTTKPVVTEAPTEAPTPKPTTTTGTAGIDPIVTLKPVPTTGSAGIDPIVTLEPVPTTTTGTAGIDPIVTLKPVPTTTKPTEAPVVTTEAAVVPPPVPTEAPTPKPTTKPTEAPVVTEAPTPKPTTKPTEAPVVTDAPTPKPTTKPVVTEAPTEAPTPKPTTKPTEAPVVTTGAPVNPPPVVIPPTDAPVDPPTDAPVVPPTDAPVVPPTDAPVVPPTDAPVVPPTDAPVEPTSTTSTTKGPTTTTTEGAAGGGAFPVVAIGAAAGGAAALAAAGVVAAKFAGVGAFGAQTPPTGQVLDNMDVPDAVEDREMMQSIPADMFT